MYHYAAIYDAVFFFQLNFEEETNLSICNKELIYSRCIEFDYKNYVTLSG